MKQQILEIYNILFKTYGKQFWWPGNSPWEIAIGAILTQNTNWRNVEKAIVNLKNNNLLSLNTPKTIEAHNLYPAKFANLDISSLEQMIRPSGYFRMKSERLMIFLQWWSTNVNGGHLKHKKNVNYWRDSILEVKGIGPETADSILLYAFNLPTFVIDTYTKRIMARHLGVDININYNELRNIFMKYLPNSPALFNEYHALIVKLAINDCPKKGCSLKCPLNKKIFQ